jgi:hypothetical protein
VIELHPASKPEEEPLAPQDPMGDIKCEPCSPELPSEPSFSLPASLQPMPRAAPAATLRELSPPEPAFSQSAPGLPPSTSEPKASESVPASAATTS